MSEQSRIAELEAEIEALQVDWAAVCRIAEQRKRMCWTLIERCRALANQLEALQGLGNARIKFPADAKVTLRNLKVKMKDCCGRTYEFAELDCSESVPCPCGAAGYWVVLREPGTEVRP